MDLNNLELNSYNDRLEANNYPLETQNSFGIETTNLPLIGESIAPIEPISIQENDYLSNALDLVADRLEQFSRSSEFKAGMEIAFGIEGTKLAAQNIIRELIAQRQQPEIKIVDAAKLGARGAYATETETIYLARDLLSKETETAARVIAEEIGHYIDSQISEQDAIGDEGEIFAARVFGDSLSDRELSTLKAENDFGVRFLDNISLTVELASVHLRYGNPSGASNYTYSDYFLEKSQYALSYNSNKGTANWVSWQLNNNWLGSAPRQNDFREDLSLPSAFYRVDGNDYRGSGYDRGHLVASADRTRSITDNSSTFYMTNMMPQSPGNNQGPWRELEEYSRNLVRQGKELYIVAGGTGSRGTIANGNVTVPEYTWKTILILDRPGATITENTETLAIYMPNLDSVRTKDWRDYLVSIDTIESRTGYDFYALISDSLENTIESRVYGSNLGGSAPTPTNPPSSPFNLSIRSLLPNPSGNENINERAEIINQGSQTVDLTGWKLKDKVGTTWSLDSIGTLGANQYSSIKREGQSMALNNSGDTIQLIDPFGNVVDTVTYQNALTDRWIFF